MSVLTLQDQWIQFIGNPCVERNFTKDLYEAIQVKANMVAHFDKYGFYQQVFRTLNSFDHLLECMYKSPLKVLLTDIDPKLVGMARYLIACKEKQTHENAISEAQDHIAELQAQFDGVL